MKRKMEAILAAVPLLVLAGTASAGEPLQLSDGQMDKVTAAGSAMAQAMSEATGLFVITGSESLAEVGVLGTQDFQATSIQYIGSLSQASSLADTTGNANGNDNGG